MKVETFLKSQITTDFKFTQTEQDLFLAVVRILETDIMGDPSPRHPSCRADREGFICGGVEGADEETAWNN